MTQPYRITRRRFLKLLPAGAAAGVLVACGAGTSPRPISPSATPVPATSTAPPTVPLPTATRELPSPAEIARRFLDSWQAGDFNTMYSYLTPETRASLSRERFEARYRELLDVATLNGYETGELDEVVMGEEVAAYDFDVLYRTSLLGELALRPRLLLQKGDDGTWGIAWNSAAIIPELSDTARLRLTSTASSRGAIFDRNGEPLAIEGAIISVGVVPGQIEDENAVLARLGEITGLDGGAIVATYQDQPAEWFIPIADVRPEQLEPFQSQLEDLSGVTTRERGVRSYPQGALAAHVVGYAAPVTAEDLETLAAAGYTETDSVGKAGIELWGEELLAGRKGGRLTIITPDDQEAGTLLEVPEVASASIYLTIDSALQRACEAALGERKGAVVLLDVEQGVPLAIASWPRYDPNALVNPLYAAERQALLAREDQPFLHRATQGNYPSGSLFKIITMAAGMELANLPTTDPHLCTGVWTELGLPMRCWKEEGHGEIDLFRGLEQSCNVVFYETGVSLHNTDEAALSQMAARFGIGAPSGVEVVESEGLLPSPDWKREAFDEVWTTGDTVNLAIGQGYLQVTPVQMARAVLAIATGGQVPVLTLIDRAEDASGATLPKTWQMQGEGGQLNLPADVLAAVREAMRGVTVPPLGTASDVFGDYPIPVAGKTGTAETRPGAEAHAWFAGYAPAEAPQLAFLGLVEQGGPGSEVAAPMMRQVLDTFFNAPS